jgi:hypothetical protein
MSLAIKWMELEIIIYFALMQNQPDSGRQILHAFSYMWNPYFFKKRHESRRQAIWEEEGNQWKEETRE